MSLKFYLFLLFFVACFQFSCQKDSSLDESSVPNDKPAGQSLGQLNVPAGFTWESSRNVRFSVAISDSRFGDGVQLVSLYDRDPAAGGSLLSRGAATVEKPFETSIYLPDVIKSVFIVKTAPDGSKISQKAEAGNGPVSVTFSPMGAGAIAGAELAKSKLSAAGEPASGNQGPDNSTGCDILMNLARDKQQVTVSNGKTTCLGGSGKNFTISFSTGGGTLRIGGSNLSITDIKTSKGNSPIRIVVTSTGAVGFPKINMNGANNNLATAVLENYGNVIFNDNMAWDGPMTNYGSLTVKGDYASNSGIKQTSSHTNYGTITVMNGMSINSNILFTNNASVVVNGDLNVLGNSTFINNCNLWVKQNFKVSELMKNYNLIKVDGQTKIDGNSELSLFNGAMIRTGSMWLDGRIKGYGDPSLVKVLGNTKITGGGSVSGTISYCDVTGIETNLGSIGSGAAIGCSLYIPVSSCNSEGNGTPPVIDTDQDGVADKLDEFPLDPKRAFNNFYAPGGSAATLAFEDKWPLKGDYDLNDLVMSYRYQVITDAKNRVVEVIGDFTLHATGGTFENGFGIEFPVKRAKVGGVTGGTLESGQTNAVVVLFTNMRQEMEQWNTVPGQAISPEKNYHIDFMVTDGPELSAFTVGAYNPFIWNNSKGFGRGYEVHLPGQKPTNLANPGLFKTGDDNSEPAEGKYYESIDNLPWAITVPVDKFAYPIERTDICSCYKGMASWAQSRGSANQDWYCNMENGNMDMSKLFPGR